MTAPKREEIKPCKKCKKLPAFVTSPTKGKSLQCITPECGFKSEEVLKQEAIVKWNSEQ